MVPEEIAESKQKYTGVAKKVYIWFGGLMR